MPRLLNRVLRGGEFSEISVRDVVPGDIVVIKPGTMYCDLVVVQAQQIVVDESALTGEATPVTKTELDPSTKSVTYSSTLHKSNTMSAGTVVIEVREGEKSLGLVLKTGSFTTKGELLTDVLSYERHKFKFDDEVKLVLFILLLEAILLLGLVFYFLQDQWVYAWFYGKCCCERPIRVYYMAVHRQLKSLSVSLASQVFSYWLQSSLPCYRQCLLFPLESRRIVSSRSAFLVPTLKVSWSPAR